MVGNDNPIFGDHPKDYIQHEQILHIHKMCCAVNYSHMGQECRTFVIQHALKRNKSPQNNITILKKCQHQHIKYFHLYTSKFFSQILATMNLASNGVPQPQ